MKKVLVWCLFATFCVACTEDVASLNELDKAGGELIYATIEEDDTRVQLNDKVQTVWTAGDRIIRYGSDNAGNPTMDLWQFNGKTGDRSGSFSYLGSYSGIDTRVKYDKYYAMYNHSTTYGWLNDGKGTPVFYTQLPATQSYMSGSYGLTTNTMLGTSADGTNFSFKNVFGYLRLSLTGSKVVDSIEISGNGSEVLAGIYKYLSDFSSLGWYSDQSTSITIECDGGVQLTNRPTYFYVVMPVCTFEQGISIAVNFTDETIYPKSTSKSVTIKRNTILPMANIDTGGEVEWQRVKIHHAGSVVAAPIMYGASSLSGEIYWGDGYMSPFGEYDEYTYTDGAATHVIEVVTLGATAVELESCSGVTEIDLSNF